MSSGIRSQDLQDSKFDALPPELQVQCDQMRRIFAICAIFGDAWVLFLDIYLLLGTFWAKFSFTGGDFFSELIYCWALFLLTIGL